MTELKTVGGVTAVMLSGDLDHHSAGMMRTDIDREITEKHPRRLVIDFSRVTFMDSSGIGLIMGRFRETSRLGAQLYIFNPQPPIEKLLLIAGMDKLAKIQTNGKKEKYKR